MSSNASISDIMRDLAEPFPVDVVGWKPQSVKGNIALALAYIDARDVQDRLDQVVGPNGWQNEYTMLDNNNVICTLKVRIDGEWIVKQDVGGPSEQPDAGDRCKAAFSDAFKRAAVLFGIGRYLYRLEAKWCDWDATKRQFTKTPPLPAWALPRRISREQADEIKALLSDTDSNEVKFLDWLIVGEFGGRPENVASIPCRLYQRAVTQLKLKKANLAKAAAEKPGATKKTPAAAAVAAN